MNKGESMILFHVSKMRSVAVTAVTVLSGLMACNQAYAATTSPVVSYMASGTFGSVVSGPDGLKLSGEPFSITVYVSEGKTPTKSGSSGGNTYAAYAPLDMTGTVQSALLPMPTNFNAYGSVILVQTPSGRDQFQLYAPVKIEGSINIHGIILLPPGTLSSVAVAPFSTAPAIPQGSILTYTTGTGSTTLQIAAGSIVKGTIYTGAAAAPAVLHANGIRMITGHADGTQSVRSLHGAPVEMSASPDKVMLQFYAAGVNPADVHMQLAGQDVPVLYAGPSGHFAGLDEVVVEVPRSLMGAGDVNAVLTTGGQSPDPVSVRIQ
jgi:hypothetical protein